MHGPTPIVVGDLDFRVGRATLWTSTSGRAQNASTHRTDHLVGTASPSRPSFSISTILPANMHPPAAAKPVIIIIIDCHE